MHSGIILFEKVTPPEVPQLEHLARKTFCETFAAENTEADMQKYLEEELTTDKLAAEINDPSCEIYFMKESHQVVGYLTLYLVSDPEILWKQGLKIERLYLLNRFLGKGYGLKLLGFAEEKLRQHQRDYLWLGVWERNYRAIRFYRRNGFAQTGTCRFILGEDVQTDLVMKKFL